MSKMKLKNCPFCQSKVDMVDMSGWCCIDCDNCGATVAFSAKNQNGAWDEATKEQTIELFNRRAGEAVVTVTQNGRNCMAIKNVGTMTIL